MSNIPEKDWQFLPVPVALAGPSHGFVQVISSHWWNVCPGRGLRFYNPTSARGRRINKGFHSPQCNSNWLIADRLKLSGDEVQYFERVFVPIALDDYA